jgi:hypothetical protein
MTCPRCGLADVLEPSCPRCGVVFAKLGARRPRPSPQSKPAIAPPRAGHGLGALVLPLFVVALGLAGLVWWRQPASVPAARTTAPDLPRLAPSAPADDEPAPPPLVAPSQAPPPPIEAGGIAAADLRLAETLRSKAIAPGAAGPDDVRQAEELAARYPDQAGLRDLLGALLLNAGRAAELSRRSAQAAALYRRASQVLPASSAPLMALMALHLALEEWAAAEAAARDALSLDAANAEALAGLGFALHRQDRDREAAEALRAALAIRDTPPVRALLAKVEKGLSSERGMTEQRISHFNVRYDGDTHEDVGREILRLLERHFATLVITFDYQPEAVLPVILFSRQQYFDASGAPAWSGGAYDSSDGRIRIPIGGLTASLTSDIDNVLVHEVTHAFIADRSRGAAPRELHEGLAQYMEGKRLASLLRADQLRTLADGQGQGVGAYYLLALSFAEYLMAQRGQGGINDLLRVMGETGNADAAFTGVYGQGFVATQRAWMARFRQEYGS